jgi:hypothetical protein
MVRGFSPHTPAGLPAHFKENPNPAKLEQNPAKPGQILAKEILGFPLPN